MNDLALPNGQTATIKSKMDVSERDCRKVDDAQIRSAKSMDLVMKAGVDVDDPSTFDAAETAADKLAALGLDGPREWLKVLADVFIANRSEFPDDLLDLPRGVYDPLVKACMDAYAFVEADEDPADPKASPAASDGSPTP